MNALLLMLSSFILTLLTYTYASGDYEGDFQEFCLHFDDLRRQPYTGFGNLENDFTRLKEKLIENGKIPESTETEDSAVIKKSSMRRQRDPTVEYALKNLCVDPSTYFNPECLYARRYEITLGGDAWYTFSELEYPNEVSEIYVDLWLLHPLLRGCLEKLNKPLNENNAKDRLLTAFKEADNTFPYVDILNPFNNFGPQGVARQVVDHCIQKPVIDETFCHDLPDIIKLSKANRKVRDESRSGVKWNAFLLHFAMIKQNNPGKYTDVYPTAQESTDLIVKNLKQIFQYTHNGQTTELKEMMAVVPEKSRRSGCENLLSLPSNTKNHCMFWKVVSQIHAFLKSTDSLGNGKFQKILNTNIDYPSFLSHTDLSRILTIVQSTENALPRLGEWVTSEVHRNVDDRFRGLRTYFRKVEYFNSQKAEADVNFIKDRLNDYRDDVQSLSNNLADELGTILDNTFVAVGLEVAEKTAQLVIAGVILANPLEKIFGGSSVGEFVDRTADLAHAIVSVGELVTVKLKFDAVQVTTKRIAYKFKKNDDFLEDLNLLLQSSGQETSSEAFESRKTTFLEKYTAYNPEVRRPELTGMTTLYGDLIEAACNVIRETDTTAAAIPKALVIAGGLCTKAKKTAAVLFETLGEIYDFQFELIEAMATYMRAVTSQYTASEIVADYEERSLENDINEDFINDLKTLSLVAYICYKINIWEVTESYCEILAYKEGGVRPNVCSGLNTNIASLVSYSSPQCRNEIDYKDVPISATNGHAFMNLDDLYAGKDVIFKIPNSEWLVTNRWIRTEDKDSTIVVKTFAIFLPTSRTTVAIARSEVQVAGNNQLHTSSNTTYVIVPKHDFIFQYREAERDQPCRQRRLPNPYGVNLPDICPLSSDENNVDGLFPSIYSRWKVSTRGYETGLVPSPANQDFKLKVGIQYCILKPTNSDNESKGKRSKSKTKMKSSNKTKLHHPERETCPKDQYWSVKSKKCTNCPKGSRPVLDGYFCEKIPKNEKQKKKNQRDAVL